MDNNELLEEIKFLHNQYKDIEKTLISKLQKYVQDKNIPLEERWGIFETCDLGKHKSFYCKFEGVNWDDFNYYDNLYMDRYSTITVFDIIKILQDLVEDGREDINIDEAKEYFLQKFIRSICNDW